jgi:hypothetical protein
MTTTIAVYNSDGCVGRCDAKCHNADPSKPCDCICGGKNHGAGRDQAIRNNEELLGVSTEQIQKFAEAHGLKPNDLHVIDRLKIRNSERARRVARRALQNFNYPLGLGLEP